MKGVPGWSVLLTLVCNFLSESPGETLATIFQKTSFGPVRRNPFSSKEDTPKPRTCKLAVTPFSTVDATDNTP